MDYCDSEFHSCRCKLHAGHHDHMPHVCACGGAWDTNHRVVRWPKPEQSKRLEELLPTPRDGAEWAWLHDECRFVKVGSGDLAR